MIYSIYFQNCLHEESVLCNVLKHWLHTYTIFKEILRILLSHSRVTATLHTFVDIFLHTCLNLSKCFSISRAIWMVNRFWNVTVKITECMFFTPPCKTLCITKTYSSTAERELNILQYVVLRKEACVWRWWPTFQAFSQITCRGKIKNKSWNVQYKLTYFHKRCYYGCRQRHMKPMAPVRKAAGEKWHCRMRMSLTVAADLCSFIVPASVHQLKWKMSILISIYTQKYLPKILFKFCDSQETLKALVLS